MVVLWPRGLLDGGQYVWPGQGRTALVLRKQGLALNLLTAKQLKNATDSTVTPCSGGSQASFSGDLAIPKSIKYTPHFVPSRLLLTMPGAPGVSCLLCRVPQPLPFHFPITRCCWALMSHETPPLG